ncbi:MAG: triose-phosphate isomerase [Candidatus Colwellbacteria bacterium]|nr:triose-phosphate isomerase [Candidatus Colwellbacteria bacterium]
MAKLIVANWKSNPNTLREAVKLAKASDFKNAIIAPPYPYLESVGRILKRAALGAQDAFYKGGPFTGEVSPDQLKNLKVKYVILGHSERRRYLDETDELINQKVKTALRAGLKVILCIGEDKAIHRQGPAAIKRFLSNQLKKDLHKVQGTRYRVQNLLIVYEPIWAISTEKGSKPDTPAQAAKIIAYLKWLLAKSYELRAIKVLYGGSVTSRNAKSFLARSEIDGALVGGASLKPGEIKKIKGL